MVILHQGRAVRQLHDPVAKFNANGSDGLTNRKSPGQPSRLNAAHRAALAAMIESGPSGLANVGVARRRPEPNSGRYRIIS
jgi:transposase